MEYNQLGKTGLKVSRLGVGISEIGFNLTLDDEKQASDVLNTALDQGINFFDTAACYGLGEEFIGRTVSNRREEFFLVTKAGHVAGDYEGEAWTAQTITDSIDRSLERMRTDHLDLIQLHSCSVEVLEKGDAISAIQDAKKAGKTRFIGYSGDNENALWAVESGLFDTLQTSFNVVDQDARTKLFPKATAQGMGIISKRPIANAVWGAAADPRPYAQLPEYTVPYFKRAQKMLQAGAISGAPDDRILLALGFNLAHLGINVAIVGTLNPKHMRNNIDMFENSLPINDSVVKEIHRRFQDCSAEDPDEWKQRG